MRATRRPAAPAVPVDDVGPTRHDVIVRPAPIAMVWQGADTAHAAIAVPGVSLGPGDVLVAVELATVCPADAATVRGNGAVKVPLVLGHEQVGRIAAIGGSAETADGARLIVGMRVVWSRRIGCGSCDACLAGSPSGCATAREYGADRLRRGWELSGGFATHVLVRSGTAIFPVPEVVPAAVLAPVPCATALAAAAVEGVLVATEVDGEDVVVLGADLVGLTAAAMLADEGARVIVVDADRARRARAHAFGAAAAVADVAGIVSSGRPIVAVVDAAPAPRARPDRADSEVHDCCDRAAELVGGGVLARIVHLHGAPAATHRPSRRSIDSAPDPVADGAARDRVLLVDRPDPRHLAAAVAFVSNAWYRYPLEDLVSVRYPLERLDDALRAAAEGPALRVGVETSAR
ncbi:alcohol dehydrogenase [Labedella populi]|uniref:alcohol dehydrogenase n=1 Tax=Labedella populi TaxID=2498850 RepID=A0A3S3ZWU1_9MICO|nr:alcohol dehydrogenase catalytic domain-containing protein [Labedella populi]RWZ68375.1 alcohol dehydrogenase [Labedella populi]